MIENLRLFHTRKIDACWDSTRAQQTPKRTIYSPSNTDSKYGFEQTNKSPVHGNASLFIHQYDQTTAAPFFILFSHVTRLATSNKQINPRTDLFDML